MALSHPNLAILTGAFSYTGRYVARRLLDESVSVRTLTRNPDREGPFGDLVPAAPLDFSDPDGLCRSMQGAGVLYKHLLDSVRAGADHLRAGGGEPRVLFDAAVLAGVGRIVHFSVANASPDSASPYFRGKGQVEEILKETGIPYAIIGPTLVFGAGDLLLNNMAWALRRLPVFPVFGKGDYPVRPIYAEDLAAQAVDGGSESENIIADAAGPETFTFEELLRLLASSVGARVRLVHTPPSPGLRHDSVGSA